MNISVMVTGRINVRVCVRVTEKVSIKICIRKRNKFVLGLQEDRVRVCVSITFSSL